jgi:hypothetical protein
MSRGSTVPSSKSTMNRMSVMQCPGEGTLICDEGDIVRQFQASDRRSGRNPCVSRPCRLVWRLAGNLSPPDVGARASALCAAYTQSARWNSEPAQCHLFGDCPYRTSTTDCLNSVYVSILSISCSGVITCVRWFNSKEVRKKDATW